MFNHHEPTAVENRLSTAVGNISPESVLIRLFPEQRTVTHFYNREFFRVLVTRDQEKCTARLIRRYFGNNPDWRHAHDFHIPSGNLYLTPHPTRMGYVPEDDLSFGLATVRLIATAASGAR